MLIRLCFLVSTTRLCRPLLDTSLPHYYSRVYCPQKEKTQIWTNLQMSGKYIALSLTGFYPRPSLGFRCLNCGVFCNLNLGLETLTSFYSPFHSYSTTLLVADNLGICNTFFVQTEASGTIFLSPGYRSPSMPLLVYRRLQHSKNPVRLGQF